MTAEVINLLKKLEGYRQYPYDDHKGWSIGYGHFIGKDKSAWTGGITQAQAHDLLLKDIATVESSVQKYFNEPLSGNKLDAATLFAFNFGPAKLGEATFVKLINQGSTDIAKIEEWWRAWNKASGKYYKNLEQRRIMETDIWFGRPVRVPDYIGGGVLNIYNSPASDNSAAPAIITAPTPVVLPPKKKFPVVPVAIGVTVIAATAVALYAYNRKLRSRDGGFERSLGWIPPVEFPFWAKALIGLGVFTVGTSVVVYAMKPKDETKPLPPAPPVLPSSNNYTNIMGTLSSNGVLTSDFITIKNLVEGLPRHKKKKYTKRALSAIQYIVLHHTAGNPADSAATIAKYHVEQTADKFPGIGYHFLISPDGTIEQTNFLQTISWHVAAFNSPCIGICFKGNFEKDDNAPTAEQIASGQKLIAAIQAAMGRTLKVVGHKEVAKKGHATACPGRNFPISLFTI